MIGFILMVVLVTILFFGFLWSVAQEHEFSKTDVKYIQPIPYFGNFFKPLFGLEHFTTTMKRIYDRFQGERYMAIFEMFTPTIILRDPELIKMVTIKDFDHFHDFPIQIDENVDPVFGKTVLALKGKKWRQMRSTLSPAFTSSKMKNMFYFLVDCANKLTSYYEEECDKCESLDLDVYDTSTRFISDSIASAVFGLEINSLKDKDNEFYKHSGLVTKQNLITGLKFAGFRVFPGLMKKLGIALMPKSSTDYLMNVISDAMDHRESSGEYRPDMIHLLNEAKKGKLKHTEDGDGVRKEFASTEESSIGTTAPQRQWTKEDLIPQALLFIAGGYTSTGSLLSFLFYELGINQDVQDRLRKEIDDLLEKNDGKMSYDDILRMTYMDMVISEALRKWPPTPFINRLCVKEYDFGPMNAETERTFKIKENNSLWIPVYAIHLDPEYWPDPMKFDPERFSEENKRNILPQTYMPFGSGPRNCLGSRFALMIIKILVFHLLAKFKFEPCSKTVIPMRIRKNSLFLESKDGYWLNIKKRVQ